MYLFRITLAALGIFCLSILAIWTMSPYLATRSITAFFAEQDAQFEIASISINPLSAEINGRAGRVTTKDGVPLEFDGFHIQLALLPLINHRLVVSAITLEGLNLAIKQEEAGWRVAGVYVPDKAAASAERQEPGMMSEDRSRPWQVSLPSIELHNSRVRLSRRAPKGANNPAFFYDDIHIPRLTIQDISGQGANWKGNASAVLKINGADIALNARTQVVEGKFVQWVEIGALNARLRQFAHHLPPAMKDSNAEIDLAGEVVINGEAGNIRITATTKKLALSRVDLKIKGLTLESVLTTIGLDRLQLMLNPPGPPKLILKGKLHSTGTRIQEGAGKSTLAAWDELHIEPIQMGMDETMELEIGQITSDNLTVSQVAQDGERFPPLLSATRVLVQNINSTRAATHAGLIELNNIRSYVYLDKNRQIITLVKPRAALEEQPDDPAETAEILPSGSGRQGGQVGTSTNGTAADTAPLNVAPGNKTKTVADDFKPSHVVAIDRIEVNGDSQVHFVDESITPTFEQAIAITSASAEGLNTGAPKQSVHLLMDVRTDKYSRINSDTRIWPMAKRPTLETHAGMHEIDLPPLSPYVADALGYEISSGQMDMQMNMSVDNGEISGESNMLLRGIDLQAANAEAGIAKDTEIISLNVAISLLKDRNGNVALDVPLYGDIDSPSFGWSGFVAIIARRAIAEALSSYLIRTFVPYANLVSIVKFASDRVLKIQVDSPEYAAAQIELGARHRDFIRQFRKLLLDKKGVYVKACPVAIPQDLNLPETRTALSQAQSDELNAIAKRRGQAFKDKILEGTDISSARILLCAPTVDSTKGAKPRIEFDVW